MKRLSDTGKENLKEIFKRKPISLIQSLMPEIRWPKVIRNIFADIWLGRAGNSIIMIGPRGGGKSAFLGTFGFCDFYLRDRSVVDLGGSLAQAKIVYNYFVNIVYSHESVVDSLPKEPMLERTEGMEKNYFMCASASPKSVRGPHPDTFMGDEVCETDDELVMAALPMVDTSENPIKILTSTFHNPFGIFQDIWDRADELGYTRYKWDIFDICKKFDKKIWRDEKLNREIPDLGKLEALANGRTGDVEGWVPIMNVINAWRSKKTLDSFMVEYMGNRPSSVGMVNDPVDVDNAVFDPGVETQYNYVVGSQVVGGLDWGFSSMTSWVAFMSHKDGVKVNVQNRNYSQVESEIIIDDIVDDVREYDIKYIYADNAGKFENKALKSRLEQEKLDCMVIEVVFSKDKTFMLGNYRAYFERAKIKIPNTYKTAIWQHKRYKFMPGTNTPVKKDDHIPDATMCALKHWPLGESQVEEASLRITEGPKPITHGLRNMRF